MGAYGAALTARMHYADVADGLDDGDSADYRRCKTVDIAGVTHTASSIVSGSDLDNLSMTSERDVCKLCQNHCKLTITTFQDGIPLRDRQPLRTRRRFQEAAFRQARTCTTTSTSVASPTVV